MNNLKFVIGVFIIALGVIAFLHLKTEQTSLSTQQNKKIKDQQLADCTPTFADGGGPYYYPNSPFRTNIAPGNHNGEKLVVSGQILERDCVTPVAGAVLDIWQANESGNYEDEWYRGKVRTNEEGGYTFKTVIPSGYGEGTGYRPPHIHFKVFKGDFEIITSQMFFPEAHGREGFDDAYIMEVKTSHSTDGTSHQGYHDIILP